MSILTVLCSLWDNKILVSFYKKNWLLFGWFYCMSALVGLFSAKINLTIMVTNYIEYKDVSLQSIYMSKHFIISSRSIEHIDGILTSITTQGKSRPGSNGNERVLYTP